MRRYHFYCMNERGGIDYAEDIDAIDDRRALERVRDMRPRARICEIWEEGRLVACIKARDVVAAAMQQVPPARE